MVPGVQLRGVWWVFAIMLVFEVVKQSENGFGIFGLCKCNIKGVKLLET
jgi:hypothetical protein